MNCPKHGEQSTFCRFCDADTIEAHAFDEWYESREGIEAQMHVENIDLRAGLRMAWSAARAHKP